LAAPASEMVWPPQRVQSVQVTHARIAIPVTGSILRNIVIPLYGNGD